jgi:prepilin-type N-terminal cleavage/methylation domain-containing protein
MTRRSSRSRQVGFTLVELVCVMVILGILTVYAVPRFADVADSAHQAVVAQTAGALQTGVMQAYIGCLIKDHAGKDNLPGFGDGSIDLNANCFPASTNGNNGNVNANRCVQVWNGVLALAPTISTPASDTTQYRAQGSGTTCTFTYRVDDDDVRRFTYSTANGDVTIVANP